MSASHNIQSGSDVLIGKNEAYIMNKKKEKSVLRKTSSVYVLAYLWVCQQVPLRQSSEKQLKLTQSTKLKPEENEGIR